MANAIGEYEERVMSGKPSKRARDIGALSTSTPFVRNTALIPKATATKPTQSFAATSPIVRPALVPDHAIITPSQPTHSPLTAISQTYGGAAFPSPGNATNQDVAAASTFAADSSSGASSSDASSAADDGSDASPTTAPAIFHSANPMTTTAPAPSYGSSMVVPAVAAVGGVAAIGGGLWWWKRRTRRSNPSRRRRRNPSSRAMAIGGVGIVATAIGVALYLNAKTVHKTDSNLPPAREPTA